MPEPPREDRTSRSRVYPGDFSRVWSAAEDALRDLDGRGIAVDAHAGVLRVEARSGLGARTTVELKVIELETGEVQVDAHAAPATPFLDFGHAARTLRATLEKLDAALGA